MSRYQDIEEFTTEALRREVTRRESLTSQGLCWYCGRPLSSHTCKHAVPKPPPPPPKESRLLQAARVLGEAPDELFRMDRFLSREPDGTVCRCLGGWIAVDSWFRKHTSIPEYFDSDGAPYDDETAWLYDLIGEQVLVLSQEDGHALFNAHAVEGVTKAAVMANLRDLMAGQPARHYAGGDVRFPSRSAEPM